MTNSITVLSNSIILQENRQDPITGDLIKEGDKVVICASCKSAFLEGSWNYLGQQHCQQRETLNQIPVKQTFKFVKKLEQVIFSANMYGGNTALIVAVPTGIISFIISILLILNVTDLLWLWGVVAGLISIPFIFNLFETKSIEIKETAIYIKKGFSFKRKIPMSELRKIELSYYNGIEKLVSYNASMINQPLTYSIPPTITFTLRKHNEEITLRLSEYDFNKDRAKFIDFFSRIKYIIPIYLRSNDKTLIQQFEEKADKV